MKWVWVVSLLGGCIIHMTIKIHKISECVRDMTVLMMKERGIDNYDSGNQ